MEYLEYKKKVQDELINYMPAAYKEWKVKTGSVKKNSVDVDYVTVFNRSSKLNALPVAYLNTHYEEYKITGDIERSLRNISNIIVDNYDNIVFSEEGGLISLFNQTKEIPIWEKMCLTMDEAYRYSGVGIYKLRQLAINPRCPFVLHVGAKTLIKRKKFEEWIEQNIEI